MFKGIYFPQSGDFGIWLLDLFWAFFAKNKRLLTFARTAR
jgi:hypothetical protein